MPASTNDKEQVLTRLRRIEGQVRGLQRLVDEDAYCIDVLTQITAVDKALRGPRWPRTTGAATTDHRWTRIEARP
jgi:DNA-binding FrmR family transcriptional regulator